MIDEPDIDPNDAPEDDEPASEQEGDEDADQEGAETDEEAEGEDETGDDQKTDESEGDFEELELDGKKVRIPAAVKPLLMMQADYTRKTQEVAEQRREVEAAREAVKHQAEAQKQFRDDYGKLAAYDASLAQFEQVDWAKLVEEDPVRAQKLDIQHRQLRDQRQQIAAGIQQKEQERSQAEQRDFAKQAEESAKVLQRDIPGWGPETQQKLREYGLKQGYGDDELNSVVDARAIKILHKSRLWDEHVEKQKAAATKKPKPSVQPLAKPAKGRAPARTGLHDELSPEEWAKRREQELAKKSRAG